MISAHPNCSHCLLEQVLQSDLTACCITSRRGIMRTHMKTSTSEIQAASTADLPHKCTLHAFNTSALLRAYRVHNYLLFQSRVRDRHIHSRVREISKHTCKCVYLFLFTQSSQPSNKGRIIIRHPLRVL